MTSRTVKTKKGKKTIQNTTEHPIARSHNMSVTSIGSRKSKKVLHSQMSDNAMNKSSTKAKSRDIMHAIEAFGDEETTDSDNEEVYRDE
tara:strand:+ start:230 stop:496 length:267 start_codon:yes stop_codon:yes gene_type:complete